MTRAKVLYVDDEEQNVAVLQNGTGDRFEVLTASKSSEAIDLLKQHEFAVVVSGGTDLLGEARSIQPDVVTMIVTAFPSFGDAVEAINQGRVVRYIRKPWRREVLMQALEDGVDLYQKNRENRALRERLISEERNVVIGKLASGLVHDLANIAAVLSIVEAVREDWDKGIDLSEELATLRGGVQKYWALLDSLKFAGMGEDIKLDKRLRDAGEIVREVFDYASKLKVTKLLSEFELEPLEKGLIAEIDGTALFHALLNLVKNAAEAAPEGRGSVCIRSVRRDGSIRIEVEDNGPGIPAEMAARILEGFHSTKGSAGTGIGLLISRRIVEGHGGKLEFRNLPQGGCVFSILLPEIRPPSC